MKKGFFQHRGSSTTLGVTNEKTEILKFQYETWMVTKTLPSKDIFTQDGSWAANIFTDIKHPSNLKSHVH
jgi:hypothetical protein